MDWCLFGYHSPNQKNVRLFSPHCPIQAGEYGFLFLSALLSLRLSTVPWQVRCNVVKLLEIKIYIDVGFHSGFFFDTLPLNIKLLVKSENQPFHDHPQRRLCRESSPLISDSDEVPETQYFHTTIMTNEKTPSTFSSKELNPTTNIHDDPSLSEKHDSPSSLDKLTQLQDHVDQLALGLFNALRLLPSSPSEEGEAGEEECRMDQVSSSLQHQVER